MGVYYRNTYWLLGDGADEEAERWVAEDNLKEIKYSSPRAVEMEETGKSLLPQLPIPPEGFVVVVVSENDVYLTGPTLGIANCTGDGGWITPKEVQLDEAEDQVEPLEEHREEKRNLSQPEDLKQEVLLRVLREMPDTNIKETPP